MLVSEMRSVGNKGCLRHTLAAATLGRVHTLSQFSDPPLVPREVTPGTYLSTYHGPIGGLSLPPRLSDLFSDWPNNATRAGTEVRPSPGSLRY